MTEQTKSKWQPWEKVKERYQRMWRRRKAALLAKLGGKCRKCGATEDLHFHHTVGRSWGRPGRLSMASRVKRYEEDAERGELELLCRSCHEDVHRAERINGGKTYEPGWGPGDLGATGS